MLIARAHAGNCPLAMPTHCYASNSKSLRQVPLAIIVLAERRTLLSGTQGKNDKVGFGHDHGAKCIEDREDNTCYLNKPDHCI